MKLYLKYFSIQLKTMLQYKKMFLLTCFTQTTAIIFNLLSIYFLFSKFGSIKNYSFDDILICFSMSFFGYSIGEFIFRAFDHFNIMIGDGEFDRILVRPRSLILQVLGSKIEFVKLGRSIAAIVVFILVLVKHQELLQIDKFLTLIFMSLGTIIIYRIFVFIKSWYYFLYNTRVGNNEYIYGWY